VNESSEQSRAVVQHGGFREGAGRKPEWFKNKCAQLASSRAFFSFAIKVFKGQNVEPRVTRTGIIYTEASVGDKVYLWEKLSAYAYGKPSNFENPGPDKSLANANAAFALLQLIREVSRNGSNGRTDSASLSNSLDGREPESQAQGSSA
jgi:hypothetical protein